MRVNVRHFFGLGVLLFAGCDDMVSQPKQTNYSPLVGPAAVPAGTVEYGSQEAEAPPLTLALIERGQERYRIYCTPCHSELGDGHGMVVQRGFPPPPSFHIDRLRGAPPQYFYDVITNGHGVMYSFADRVEPPRSLGHCCLYSRARAQSKRSACGPGAIRARGPAMRLGRAETSVWLVAFAGSLGSAIGWGVSPHGISACVVGSAHLLDRVADWKSRTHLHPCPHRRSLGLCDTRRARDRRCDAPARASAGTSAAFRAADALSLDASRDGGALGQSLLLERAVFLRSMAVLCDRLVGFGILGAAGSEARG